ncbi:MAG: 23S rRNA pseudouridine(1911/1915/1917) synthase RluD [Gammaproteobacteria bacterium]|nr:23S rRNA pseudouridine(1911/1915/1917) synthase RluD [Gammaproteobacteria bacterium]NNF62163.1 23S rRNA pseudouridine(1911/1915/1917) synthase RluD [Gammaproteobacteria bacterium]NNM21854.1 23S rRNA pseudouridine(1911/1915/1917) synthase RluD [Gammaproteobacteria bacterium]
MTVEIESHEGQVPEEKAGKRLDQTLAEMFPDFSRSRLKTWIEAGLVEVNGQMWRPRDRLHGGEKVVVHAMHEPVVEVRPEAIPIEIVHEDADLLVVNKAAGMVVHPGAGNRSGTLQNALLHFDSRLATLPRAGIVHRLDKDTSGLLVIARTLRAHTALVQALAARHISREYYAVCQGVMISGGTVDAPIGRHPVDRIRMAVVPGGRPALSHYRIAERFAAHTLVQVALESGRTHQIRVHMKHIGHPLVGDPLYGGRLAIPANASESLHGALHGFRRQALHATRLALTHPVSGAQLEWNSAMPDDLQALLDAMRNG